MIQRNAKYNKKITYLFNQVLILIHIVFLLNANLQSYNDSLAQLRHTHQKCETEGLNLTKGPFRFDRLLNCHLVENDYRMPVCIYIIVHNWIRKYSEIVSFVRYCWLFQHWWCYSKQAHIIYAFKPQCFISGIGLCLYHFWSNFLRKFFFLLRKYF